MHTGDSTMSYTYVDTSSGAGGRIRYYQLLELLIDVTTGTMDTGGFADDYLYDNTIYIDVEKPEKENPELPREPLNVEYLITYQTICVRSIVIEFPNIRSPPGGVYMLENEADMTINGQTLSKAESMTIRVAVESFLVDLCSEDFSKDMGQIGEGYKHQIKTIRQKLYGSVNNG